MIRISSAQTFKQLVLYLDGLLAERTRYIAQGDFHFGLCTFKTARLNDERELFAAPIPPVIRNPELAFETQKRCEPEALRRDFP